MEIRIIDEWQMLIWSTVYVMGVSMSFISEFLMETATLPLKTSCNKKHTFWFVLIFTKYVQELINLSKCKKCRSLRRMRNLTKSLFNFSDL